MTRLRTAAGLIVCVVFTLAGCATSTLADGDRAMCDRISGWISEGSPPERAEVYASGFEDDLAGAESAAMTSAAELFIAAAADGEASDLREAADDLTDACFDAGWEPIEG